MLKRISQLFNNKTELDSDSQTETASKSQTQETVDQLDAMLDELPETTSIDELMEQDMTAILPEELLEELPEMEPDLGYIQHAPEVVGYDTRERQWASYRLIASVIEDGASILDVGCGRGDFKVFYAQETQQEYDSIDYTGVDLNSVLINAGKEIYPDIDLRECNWLNMPADLKKDWVINVNSLNLRYDGDMMDNWEYFTKTISAMYEHAERGVAVMLASDITDIQDGLINWSPGEVLNWCQKTFGLVAVDHTYSDDMFTLTIYK